MSIVTPVVQPLVDRSVAEEVLVPSPLKPVTPADVVVEDVIHKKLTRQLTFLRLLLKRLFPGGRGTYYPFGGWSEDSWEGFHGPLRC